MRNRKLYQNNAILVVFLHRFWNQAPIGDTC